LAERLLSLSFHGYSTFIFIAGKAWEHPNKSVFFQIRETLGKNFKVL
jgi:hypothetical protein